MKNKVLITVLTITLLVILLFNSSVGRYIYNAINDYILSSKNFYFSSSILSNDGEIYSIVNWDGVNPYVLNIDVNGKKNELVSTNSDIEYDIFVDCPSTVICSLDKTSGIIYSEKKVDSYIITVTPVENFYGGDSVSITTKAVSTYPYSKELSATYNIGVENYGFSYEIVDSEGSKYLTLDLTNSKPYYEVIEPFGDYAIGDLVSIEDYNSLDDLNKNKCRSIQTTITFDPNEILLDLTGEPYLNSVESTTTTINDSLYVNGITLNVGANTNKKIIFYKNDITKNYTNSSIISVVVNE